MVRLGRRTRVSAVVLTTLLAVCIVGGLPVYVFPRTDTLRLVDAIIVLGGPEDGREAFAEGLASEGFAPVLVYSNPYGPAARGMTNKCNAQRSFEIQCFTPEPPTTRGEAQSIARLAEQNQWTSIMVITYRPHITRARYIIGRCYTGELLMAGNDSRLSVLEWVQSYVYQTAGFARAAAQGGC